MKAFFVALAMVAGLAVGPATAVPVTFGPDWQAFADQATRLNRDGQAALRAGSFATAEADFRTAILVTTHNISLTFPDSNYGLAEAVTYQGRDAEAMQICHSVIPPLPAGEHYGFPEAKVAILYALLLMRHGRLTEAVPLLNGALPSVPILDIPLAAHISGAAPLDPASVQPAALASLSHVALGLFASAYGVSGEGADNNRAMSEFTKALQLAPNSDLANFYYGYVLAKLGRNAQASIAFQKTIKMAKGEVKAAAEQALKKQKKPV